MDEATISTYLRLTEAYLWRKDVKSVSVGLKLALLAVTRFQDYKKSKRKGTLGALPDLLARYGVLEVTRQQVRRDERSESQQRRCGYDVRNGDGVGSAESEATREASREEDVYVYVRGVFGRRYFHLRRAKGVAKGGDFHDVRNC